MDRAAAERRVKQAVGILMSKGFRALYKSCGVDVDSAKPDANGFVKAACAEVPELVAINPRHDAGFWLARDGQPRGFFDFVVRRYALGESIDDLPTFIRFAQIMCDKAGIALDPPTRRAPLGNPRQLKSLLEIDDPKNMGEYVECDLLVVGKDNEPYSSPTKIKITHCPKFHACGQCNDRIFDVEPTSTVHVEHKGASNPESLRIIARAYCPINKVQAVEVQERDNYGEVYVTQYRQRLEEDASDPSGVASVDGRSEAPMPRRAVYFRLNKEVEIEPRGYHVTGKVIPNPHNQAITLIVDRYAPIYEPYERFEITDEVRTTLQLLKDLGPRQIMDDLVLHQTRMSGNDDLLQLVLLTYCSPLRIHFNGERDMRGWLVATVVGDSATGKSQTWRKISQMVGFGDTFCGVTGRRTGLAFAYTKQLSDGHWKCQIGALGQNDKRLLAIEEAQALAKEDMDFLREGLEFGVVKAQFSETAKFNCRTRVIANANCKNGRTLASYSHGCKALNDLYHPEVIRRMDVAMFLRRREALDEFNAPPAEAAPLITPEHMRTLVCWAWSLGPDQVVWEDEATALCLEEAKRLPGIYGWPDELPLLGASCARHKIARLASAFAVWGINSDDGFRSVRVHKTHVQAAVAFMERVYSAPSCQLDHYNQDWLRSSRMGDYDAIVAEIQRRLSGLDALEGKSPFAKMLAALEIGTIPRRKMATACKLKPAYIELMAPWFESALFVRKSQGVWAPTEKWGTFKARFSREFPMEWGKIVAAGRRLADAGQEDKGDA